MKRLTFLFSITMVVLLVAGMITSPTWASNITVRARGTNGSEQIRLTVNNQTVQTWTLTTSMANYSASTSLSGGTNVCFINDASGRDVQVDYITVDGSTRQSESQSYNTGVWQNSACGGSNSEWMHCNGCIGYGDSGSGSTTTTTSGSSTSTTTTTTTSGSGTWTIDARCFENSSSGFDSVAVKDPSIVNSGGKYHLFYTGKDSGNWRMGYASASSISGLHSASRTMLTSLNGGGYFCAPQVVYFNAKGKWYLIYQSGSGATYSTNSDVGNPGGWTAGQGMGFGSGAVDFWCVSDGSNVYCFYSPQDGSYTIRRRSTSVANFPGGWGGESSVCSNTFEAPHVYKCGGTWYMMVEDISRHLELWSASSLGGSWTQVNENWANINNCNFAADRWTNQVSHAEILRSGNDESCPISSVNSCQVLIQGTTGSGDYGLLPYDLGLMHR